MSAKSFFRRPSTVTPANAGVQANLAHSSQSSQNAAQVLRPLDARVRGHDARGMAQSHQSHDATARKNCQASLTGPRIAYSLAVVNSE